MSACIEGLFRCPRFDVVCRGSWPIMRVCGFMSRNASMTTLPLTDCIGSTTTATARGVSCSNDCWVLMSTEESQQPKPGCEWYHPTTVSALCRIRNIARKKMAIPDPPPCLPQHVHHFRLENRIHGLNANSGSALRHSEDVHYSDCIVIHEYSQHQTHNLHGDPCSSMSQHL